MNRSRLVVTVLLMLSAVRVAVAQSGSEIIANPDNVKLRPIWRIEGEPISGRDYVGMGAGSAGVAPNGLGMWAVYFGILGQWRVYRAEDTMKLSTTPIWSIDSTAPIPSRPVLGRFWGGDTTGIGFLHAELRTVNQATSVYYELRVFEVDSGTIAETPKSRLDFGTSFCLKDIEASDLDGDGADELIVARACDYPQILIYRGGPDFQVDHPDLVIDDDHKIGSSSAFWFTITNLDDDPYPDLITGANYADGWQIDFFFGSPTSPWDWSTPDRRLPVADGAIAPDALLSIADLDGDGRADLAGTAYGGDSAGVYLWLSGSGKDPRSRPFDRADADQWLVGTGYADWRHSVGYLNDSLHRYQMLPVRHSSTLLLFGGGRQGPNGSYDAWYEDPIENIFVRAAPLGDVDGDGWDDLIVANSAWLLNAGVAVIFAGGPYIPTDDPTVGVRQEAVAGESGGLFLWPNPVEGELNIAWRGNLVRMPRRFEVHDIMGRLVARGSVESSIGSARWECSEVPGGTYLLSVFDRNGARIAATTVIKR